MDRSDAWTGIDEQRRALVALLGELPEQEWQRPSLCDRWAVRQVAAHLALQNMTWRKMPRAVPGFIRHGGLNGARCCVPGRRG